MLLPIYTESIQIAHPYSSMSTSASSRSNARQPSLSPLPLHRLSSRDVTSATPSSASRSGTTPKTPRTPATRPPRLPTGAYPNKLPSPPPAPSQRVLKSPRLAPSPVAPVPPSHVMSGKRYSKRLENLRIHALR